MSRTTKLNILKLGASHRALMPGLLLASCAALGQAQAACTPDAPANNTTVTCSGTTTGSQSISGDAVLGSKASSGGLLGWIDKDHFDLPVDPTRAQTAGEVPYRGGFIQDERAVSLYGDNFEAQPLSGYERPLQPKRLPRDCRATSAALGKVDLEPRSERQRRLALVDDGRRVRTLLGRS